MQRSYVIQVKTESMNDFKRLNGLIVGFVIKGNVHLYLENNLKVLNQGDLFFVNHRDLYRFQLHKDSIICFVHFQLQYLADKIDDDQRLYFNLTDATTKKNINQMRNIIARLVSTHIRNNELSKLTEQQLIIQLLMHMIHYVPRTYQSKQTMMNNSKIDQVCDYIELHFHEDLSLSTLSQYVDWSESHLSKKFTEVLGMGFQQFLNQTRVEHSKLDLQYTDDSITDIALRNGFSSATTFSRTFKQFTNETPKMFRCKHDNKTEENITHQQTYNDRELIFLLNDYIVEMNHFIEDVEKINDKAIDFTKATKPLNKFKHIIQIGYLSNLLSKQYQSQLLTCHQDFFVNEVLVYDIMPYITKKLNVPFMYDANVSNLFYDIDLCLDFLMEHDIALTMHLNNYQSEVYLETFKLFMHHVAVHTNRKHNLKINIYVTELHSSLIEMMKYFKSLFPDGGLYVHFNQFIEKWLPIAKQLEQDINYFVFDANSNDAVNFDKVNDDEFKTASQIIINKTNYLIDLMAKYKIKRPLILLNWNTLTGNTYITNGEYFRGGIIVEQLLKLSSKVDMIGYWLNYDLHVSHCKTERDYMNSIELFHQYDGKRPVYYTALLYNKLSNNVLYIDETCIVTGSDSDFQVLLFDAKHFNPYLALDDEMNLRITEMIHLKIKDLSQGTYKIKHFTLDKENGALFKIWRMHHSKHGMDQDSIDYINRMSYPKLEVAEVEVTDTLILNMKMITNGIHLIEVKRYPDI
ncbi:AraC family transcriptional regulator [Staphylococcus pasteuri]|uniref:transcriptional regulator AryK n=2 Tax=Staphylococcus pasteuri TaxID=45972 RepID=UPI000D3CEFC8|nr:helix-turn-helix domain-containing protein [Staphylococcus pasteuri]PTU82403.1 AraC family transcriptional regulator [Staphylococcus pasteuri]RIO34593.1 helix-turn-helix domain-containing protein [Staphylococcus pasteuri]RIO39185.1 helix-turn-helix domain-containing protein [Staphylococcus pasteuri]